MIRMIQTAVMIIVHQTITTVIQAVTQIVVHQVAHIVTAHQVKVILQEVHQRRSTATHISLMMMDMKMFIWMMITTMIDIISDSDYADGVDDALDDYDDGDCKIQRVVLYNLIEYCTHICYTLYYL